MPEPVATAAPRAATRAGTAPSGAAPARPVRVLQVCARYLPDLGGIETHVHEVTRRLAARDGVDVTVLATDRTGSRSRRERTGHGVTVLRRRAWPRERDWYVAPGVVPVVRSGGWDLVHVQGIHTVVPVLAMAAARSAGIPYVVTFHTGGHSSAVRTSARGAQWKLLTPLLRGADRLIAVGDFERGRFEAATGIDPARFEVVRNGGGLPDVPGGVPVVPGRVVSVGRLERYKGHHRVIEALPALRRLVPGAHLQIIGAGPYEGELLALARRLGVADAVTVRFLPPGDRGSMARTVAAASAFAALSDYEAHPVAVMEALSLGVPVVGLDVAGVGDLVADGLVRGLPVGAGATAVAAALHRALTEPRPAAAPALPTWEQAADRLADVYTAVAARRARAGR